MKILLAEDDVTLLEIVSYALQREGFTISTATDGLQALQRWRAMEPDVVVLDLDLPRLGGFEVCRRIREVKPTPVILLAASHREADALRAFRLGADDYVRKPFSPRELAMRIRAVLRRVSGTAEPERPLELGIGDLVLDLEAHEARAGESVVRLTPIQFRLLHLLASHAGRVVGKTRLIDYGWRHGEGGDEGLLKTHISDTRKKLRSLAGTSVVICAVSGVGYRLDLHE